MELLGSPSVHVNREVILPPFLSHVYFIETECAKPLKFRGVRYWPDTFFQSWRHTPTEFHFDSQHIDEGSNPLFKRYVADQQYIRSFRQIHPLLARIWRWTSDYGRSVVLWTFWSILFALAFAVAYTPTPDWTPVWWQNLGSLVIPGVHIPLRNKGNIVSEGDRRMCQSGHWAPLHIL